MSYLERTIEHTIRRAASEFPSVILTGPRQSGKTTLLKKQFSKTHQYVSLEPPDIRQSAVTDPRGFLEYYNAPVILDEVQYAPELLPYIKERIDLERGLAGQYILTGSQNLLLMERVTETLAGRAAVLRLLPLSRREALRQPNLPLAWERKSSISIKAETSTKQLWKEFLRGYYPELVAQPKRDFSLWQSSYLQTYLERDIRALRQIGDLSLFQNFLRALAARHGQLLNITDISRDIGVAVNTAKAWLSVLEASYQIVLLRPYFVNAGKRLVKSPKVYFTDSGLLCHLVGLRDADHAALSPMAGAIFEGVVVMEIIKRIVHQGLEPTVYFWRTSYGAEVDIVVEMNGRLYPVEVKLSSTPNKAMTAGLKLFLSSFSNASNGYVVYPGKVSMPLASNIVAQPFANL